MKARPAYIRVFGSWRWTLYSAVTSGDMNVYSPRPQVLINASRSMYILKLHKIIICIWIRVFQYVLFHGMLVCKILQNGTLHSSFLEVPSSYYSLWGLSLKKVLNLFLTSFPYLFSHSLALPFHKYILNPRDVTLFQQYTHTVCLCRTLYMQTHL